MRRAPDKANLFFFFPKPADQMTVPGIKGTCSSKKVCFLSASVSRIRTHFVVLLEK